MTPADLTASDVIDLLRLEPHPEGGWYRRTWKSDEVYEVSFLPHRYDMHRALGSAIEFLITTEAPSRLHRVKSDEIIHHYAGVPCEHFVATADTEASVRVLGPDIVGGQRHQSHAPAMSWQGLTCASDGWTLLGATVSPAFDFDDFTLATADDIDAVAAAHPDHEARIRSLG